LLLKAIVLWEFGAFRMATLLAGGNCAGAPGVRTVPIRPPSYVW
jgi:hypothetical protein